MSVYPLIFQPIFKKRVWGGRNLEFRLGKHLPPGPIGESWELVDLEDEQSVVAGGPLQGKTLGHLVQLWGADLLGGAPLIDGRFPLLLKFLDAQQPLSVQVHPSPKQPNLEPQARIKNEAWYVIDAAPDAWILRGTRAGIDRQGLADAIEKGRVEQVLNRIPIRSGHAYYIPSGTVHALGPGALLAEVQTPSDTTYRLYDWDRADPQTGATRELHLDQGLRSVQFEPVPLEAEHPEHVASVWTAITRLIRCESFVMERVRMVAGIEQLIPYDEMVAWMVLDGAGTLSCDGLGDAIRFGMGDTVLLPAAMKNARVKIEEVSTWLEITVPVPSSLTDLSASQRKSLRSDPRTNYVPLNIQIKEGN